MDEEQINFLKKNFAFIKMIDHPNVLQYKSLYFDLNKHCCHLVTEYFPFPSLLDVSKNEQISEKELKSIVQQLIITLDYLHCSRKICHRDIKP